MKILLYEGSLKLVTKSGVGEAVRHQKKILEQLGVPYTTNPKEHFDFVHINTVFLDSLQMSRRAKRQGKKVIYYAHSTMEDFRNSFKGSNLIAPLFKHWITHCYNSGDIIITPTEYSKALLESYNIKRPIFSLSNGIDTEFFAPSSEARFRFRNKYQISPEEKVIISVGHYIKRKGILDFIKLAEQMPEYQFYWFGYTNLSLIPRKIQNAILNPPENLHFPGYVDRETLRDAYCGSELFLFLSKEETEGIVVLEALATKIPIVIRDIPIYKDWLVDGTAVYKGKSLSDFKSKVEQVISGEIPDLAEGGHAVAQKRDFKSISKQLLEIYNDNR